MGVSKNSGTPKWMVFNGKPIKMDDLGGKPHYFRKPPKITIFRSNICSFSNPKPPFSVIRQVWDLEAPRLLLSIVGGAGEMNLDPAVSWMDQF